MENIDYIALEDQYSARNYKPYDVVASHARGVWVWDVSGKRFLDCVSAYSAVNQGHCHPKIIKALTEQAEKVTLVSRAFRSATAAPFYKDFCAMTGSQRVLMMNSGAEAVETALKIVRKWGYEKKGIPDNKAEIIVCNENFHGRTIAIVGFSSIEKYKKGFGPFPSGFKRINFNDIKALEKAITPNAAGFLVEPLQGEGGINVASVGYLKKVRELCTKNKIALVFDEIQCGLGRTGKLLAEEHDNVKADLVIVGKALSGGIFPISAVLDRKGMMDVLNPGDHGSTFGGSALACAVAHSAIKVLTEEGMIENAAKMGDLLKKEIEALKLPGLKRVKGLGLMLGLEVDKAQVDPSALCYSLIESGLLCNKASDDVIRFTPPLILTEEHIGYALERLKTVFGN